MLRTSSSSALLTLCLLAHAGMAGAQQQPPSQQPPKLERIEPGSDVPATTIPPRERTRIKEKKQGGQVTEVEVQSGSSRYIMKPNVPAGNAQPGDAQSTAGRAPQWQVMEFDFGNPKKQGPTEQPVSPAPAKPGVPARADAPPPPPLEPVEKKN